MQLSSFSTQRVHFALENVLASIESVFLFQSSDESCQSFVIWGYKQFKGRGRTFVNTPVNTRVFLKDQNALYQVFANEQLNLSNREKRLGHKALM